jgi:hypothetical protein
MLDIVKQFVHFLSRERKRNQKKTPVLCGPAGCPVLLEAGGSCGTRLRSDRPQLLSRPLLRCSAHHKGWAGKNHMGCKSPLMALPCASRNAAGVSLLRDLISRFDTEIGQKGAF